MMNYRIGSAPERAVRRPLVAAMAAATLALFATSGALAQQPPAPRPAPAKQPAKPAQKPAAQQQPAQQPAQAQAQPAAGEQPQFIFSPWIKICGKPPEANSKQVCFTGMDARIETGMPVGAAVVVEADGEPKKILRVTLPLGMKLEHGSRVIVDQGQPAQAPFFVCLANGCMADYEATADLLGRLKKGQSLQVQAINMNGIMLTIPLPLAEFAKANEGPPTDPKVFEEQQKKLQDELQKKAEEARKKLESQQAAPPGKTQ